MTGLILSAWVGQEVPDVVSRVTRNHEFFARKHDYDYQFVHDPAGELLDGEGIFPEWIKVPTIQRALNEDVEWVFWIDTDSVFSDVEKNLADIITQKKPVVVAGDAMDICNTGHVFLRNAPEVRDLVAAWWAMRLLVFPPLNTTHIDDHGRVLDQPALNYLFAGGKPNQDAVTATGAKLFNRVNGFVGNHERHHKFFHYTHAPSRPWRVPMAASLMSRPMRKMVAIVPQERLNGYPRREPGSPRRVRTAPIMHYAGPRKKFLKAELDRLESMHSA